MHLIKDRVFNMSVGPGLKRCQIPMCNFFIELDDLRILEIDAPVPDCEEDLYTCIAVV